MKLLKYLSLFIILMVMFMTSASAQVLCSVNFDIEPYDTDTTVVAAIATYDDGVLSSVSVENVPISAGQSEITIEADEGSKIMLWDSLDTMKPLADTAIARRIAVESGSVLINEDFSNLSDSWGFAGSAGAVTVDGALSLCDDTAAGKIYSTIKNMDTAISSEQALKIKFDWASDVENGKDRSSGLELRDSNGALLFAMYGKGAAKEDSGIKYATIETDGLIAWQDVEAHTSGKFYTVEISANFITGKLNGTITDTATNSLLITIPETDISAVNFSQMTALNYYSLAPMTLDNVTISSQDKYMTSFTVNGNDDNTPLKNSEIQIGTITIVTDEDGKAETKLHEGEYTYTITAPHHKSYEGTITAGNSENISMEYAGESVPTTIVISGGDEGIYKPKSGTNSTSNAYTATVYDQVNQPMDDEVEWSIVASEGASIDEDTIITVADNFIVADDNGETIVVKASSKTNPEIYAFAELHVYNVARATTFDIVGPSAIKDGLSASYTIGNVKDQYGADYIGDATYTLSATENVAVDSMTVTPNTGTVQTKDFVLTATASDSDATATKTVTAYAFNFYESQIGGSYHGDVRTEEVNGEIYTVWPASVNADTSQTITLPVPVEFEPGTAKLISYSTAWTTKTVTAQKRTMALNFSGGSNITIAYQSGVYLNGDTQIGTQGEESTFEETFIFIKTDALGNSTADISYAGGTPVTVELGENIGTLTSLEMYGGKSAPDTRLLAIKDIKICDSDVPEVEISGGDVIAKIESSVATKQYKASVFAISYGETFVWSVKDTDGNDIEGVTIDQNGVLVVKDSVSADTIAVITYTSNLNSSKSASKEVIIKDFANIASFTIDGDAVVSADDSAAYSVSNIIDEYGDNITMAPSYEIVSGADIASIDSATGVLTTNEDKTGTITISVTLGNTGKKKTLTKDVIVGRFSVSGESSDANVSVNVAELENYAADTKYLVTTATSDGELVSQLETTHTNGIITVDMTGAQKYEVSPIYSYSNVGDVRNGFEILIPDGRYDFTFTKSGTARADIFVNGNIVGNNVDQQGKQRKPNGTVYSVQDVKVAGGKAVVLAENNPYLSDIVVKKAPSILPRKTHLFFAGDSTHCGYHGAYSEDVEVINGFPRAGQAQTGWGQVIDKFLGEDINVTNLAESGIHAKLWYDTYFEGGVLNQAEEGDYFIIVFGLNDTAKSTKEDMKKAHEDMIDKCREAGIIPIVVACQRGMTMMPGDPSSYLEFFEVSKAVAKEKDTLFVDMTQISGDYFLEAGTDFLRQNHHLYYNGASVDKGHLSYFGAATCAWLFVQNVADQQAAGVTTSMGEGFEGLTVDKESSYTFTMVDDTTRTLKIE